MTNLAIPQMFAALTHGGAVGLLVEGAHGPTMSAWTSRSRTAAPARRSRLAAAELSCSAPSNISGAKVIGPKEITVEAELCAASRT